VTSLSLSYKVYFHVSVSGMVVHCSWDQKWLFSHVGDSIITQTWW